MFVYIYPRNQSLPTFHLEEISDTEPFLKQTFHKHTHPLSKACVSGVRALHADAVVEVLGACHHRCLPLEAGFTPVSAPPREIDLRTNVAWRAAFGQCEFARLLSNG